ncbi:MAG: hypothetical protein RL092_653 [Bacteroidota bacterium]|jgi:hypothetical protein
MKTIFSIFVTAMLLILSNAINLQGQSIVVSNPMNNFLFKGIENPIEFYAPFKIKEIKVIGGKFVSKVSSDTVSNIKSKADDVWRLTQESGYFSIIPDCEAKVVEVIFVGKKGSMSKYFTSLGAPNPLVRFAGQWAVNNTISAPAVRSARTIDVYQAEDFVYTGLNYNIADFKVQIIHEGKTQEFVCQRNLSIEAMAATSKLQVGDRIVIYDVNVTGECGLIHLEDRLDFLVQ